MFEHLEMAPADPIFGLTEAFKKDPNPAKINLGVGVYQDETGKTPIFRAVKEAERRLVDTERNKSYLGIAGDTEFLTEAKALIFQGADDLVTSGRVVLVQTPGGTGGVRVGAEFLRLAAPGAGVWMSEPTWPNHPNIFRAAGYKPQTYPYFDPAANRLAFGRMLEALERVPEGDVVLLHGCCHNPTGIDPSLEQWEELASFLAERNLVPLVDFAYQGLGEGWTEDSQGVLALCRKLPEVLVASSFSKNFGLYCERLGALAVIAADAGRAQVALSHLEQVIRSNYSNPPAHGARIVTTILRDPGLRADWEAELGSMRIRLAETRRAFVERLRELGVERDFSYLARQRGIFSFSGLTRGQVELLRRRYSIYLVNSGRINVAGINAGNLDYLCSAVAEVIRELP
ncbi:MAG TPA: amino acid aminotransferase [Acidobacteriota bacterium]|nr:amino acid aminotransferase [Acidobacteriota bacterium]